MRGVLCERRGGGYEGGGRYEACAEELVIV